MNILFCASEVAPFAKTGGLADVCGSLPLHLARNGLKVIIVMPFYPSVTGAGVKVTNLNKDVAMAEMDGGVQILFIRHENYFNRPELYGQNGQDYDDNLERFAFFCRRVLDLVKEINFRPDIVHCHDWQTALIPAYLRFVHARDDFYKTTKSFLTIHNLAFQGVFPAECFDRLGLNRKLFSLEGFEYYGKVNLLKGGIIFSDFVSTVSPGYAQEIQTEAMGCGLDGVLQRHSPEVVGILNGVDYDKWNPAKDNHIAASMTQVDLSQSKARNKAALQKGVGLGMAKTKPLFGFVGRLSHQKGVDLMDEALEALMALKIQLVFLGTGEPKYIEKIQQWQKRYPENIAASFEFNEPLAHQIYAGSDFFLMPSVFEPCGISQLISFKYATVPVVYKTGGLADTVTAYEPLSGEGTGIVFERYDRDHFVSAIEQGCRLFVQKDALETVRRRIFKQDFSWGRSAKEYQQVYQRLAMAPAGA